MYERYWQLDSRPFEDGAAPEFYVESESHAAALMKLRYLIEQRRGAGLVAAEHGLGKSFLTQVLEAELGQGACRSIRLLFPELAAEALLSYLAARLGAEVSALTPQDVVLRELENRLADLRDQQQHALFVIDDAHLLSLAHLNVLRLLLNLREECRADFSLILCGRTELLTQVSRLVSLDQRITVRAALQPLSVEETGRYLERRLEVAGRREPLFRPDAVQAIWEVSQGIPRRINQLADLALLVGFADRLSGIDAVEIEAASAELIAVAA